jgi:predicted nuclease of restriction endonuclease-like (RecB) superfamily
MSKAITIFDKEYSAWINELSSRYRRSQIKAAVKVNQEMLQFYWELGRDIVEMHIEERWGSNIIRNLSVDLQREIPSAHCFSRTNLYYTRAFYLLYSSYIKNVPQVEGETTSWIEGRIVPQPEGQLSGSYLPQDGANIPQQVATTIMSDIFSVPWGHHKYIMDKCSANPEKAIFYVHQTVLNGWSRNVLLNFLDTDLYERQGKALTNFSRTLPDETSDLAQELTKDPYDFAFTGITGRYNERLLKDKLLNNITQFLVELGTGFAYVGKEYRLQVGEREQFIDLLFYNLNLSCYVVVEVKIGKFEFADAGQLGGYVVSCNHLLRKEGRDNPTIGLLICKEKDSLVAQYALEASSQPLGISEYELAKLYPEKVEGTIPTIEELEQKLGDRIKNIED